jgi:hypothetical protein
VPAFQRNQRNIRRSRDAAALATLIRECLTNNNSASACTTPESIGLDVQRSFSIYTGAHYGAETFPNDGEQRPPTLEEPNWLFGLRCNASLNWFIFPEEGAPVRWSDFVVTYYREKPGSPGVYSKCFES